MNSFEERFMKLSDQRLIQIMQNRADYSEEAIAAAEKEMLARNLSVKDIYSAENESEKRKENWISWSHLNKPLSDQSIKVIILILAGFSLLKGYLTIVGEVNYLGSILNSRDYAGPYWYDFIPIFLGLSALVAAFFLFKRQKIGWTLTIILLTVFMMQTVFKIINLGVPVSDQGIFNQYVVEGYTPRKDLIPQLLLILGVGLLILRADIRSFFEVSRQYGLKLFWITVLAYLAITFNLNLF